MLQNINTAIDAVESVKSQFVKTFVANEEMKKPLDAYIAAQSTFAKNVAKATVDFYTTMGMASYAFDAKKAFTKI